MSGLGNLRPSGGGRPADCTSFIRASATPRAALILHTSAEIPADWPTADGTDVTDAQLGHALGWVCEVRQNDLLILNPLGEGVFRAELPELSDEWIREVRSSESSAIYLLPETSDQAPAMAILSETAKAHAVPAASVRTSVSDDFGKMKPVGRNEPCPCGSGKKFKHCHG